MHPDVIIVGSGQAGVPLAVKLARAGKHVVLIERGDPGGTCVNTGCTPTKTMIASARAAHVARSGARLGVHARDVVVDFAAVVARKDAIVKRWRDGVLRRLREAGPNLSFVNGHARFAATHALEVDGQRYEAPTIVLDVGARPRVPSLPGVEAVPWLDNARVMALDALPAHLIVIGGGYVGCEFAQMFRRFGSEVTIVDPGEHLLGREDPEISSEIERVFEREGIRLELGSAAVRVAEQEEQMAVALAGGREIRGSHLLLATGRRPNTDDLGCEAAGFELDDRGFVRIDDRYETRTRGVYAVGDVTGEPQFTHVAWDDHRILFDLLMGRSERTRAGRAYPYTAFTDPQVAGVGLTERQARARGIPFEVARLPFGNVARAIEVDEPAGMLKVLIDPKTEQVLGAAIVGAEAGELIHAFVLLMQGRVSVRAIVDAEFVHPSFSEGVQSVVMALERFS